MEMAMNKAEFFARLREGLKRLSDEEIENAVRYYAEYFSDAGEENEAKILEELNSPEAIASQIVADHAIKSVEEAPTNSKAKKGISAIWFVLLAIFASPIALPIALAIAVVIFALIIVIFALIFAFFMVVLATFLSGIFLIICGLALIPQSIGTALAFVGIGAVSFGLSIFVLLPLVYFTRKIFGGLAKLINNRILNKKKRGNNI
ncbi:MAG: hypothetical protein K0S55_1839 [Clostridia bacterium]|nr:hypothetical protein [Clostridia bacterium]